MSRATIIPTMMRICLCFLRVRRRPFGFLLLVLLFFLLVLVLRVLGRLVLVFFLLALALLVVAFLVPVLLVLALLVRAMFASSESFRNFISKEYADVKLSYGPLSCYP